MTLIDSFFLQAVGTLPSMPSGPEFIPENKNGMYPIRCARHEDEDVRRQLPGLAHQAKDKGQHDDVDSGENELS
jgi:hypothetical protein